MRKTNGPKDFSNEPFAGPVRLLTWIATGERSRIGLGS
ncbi:hypothetical protein JOE51_002210 [Bradyrhizobium japonicum]|nr:hypothetical protein [Bradyrhizobium japonicum]